MSPTSDWLSVALEYALYGFLFLLLLAVGFAISMWRWLTGGPDPLALVPNTDPPESETQAAFERLLGLLHRQLEQVSGAERETLEEEQDRLARWYTEFKGELEVAREPFQQAAKVQRERWRNLYVWIEARSLWLKLRGRKRDSTYQQRLQEYREAEQQAQQQRQTLRAFDRVALRNLQSSSLYQRHAASS